MSTVVRTCRADCTCCTYVGTVLVEHRKPRPPGGDQHPPQLPPFFARRVDERLETLCWCERHVVYVEQTDVLAGRTEPCGAPGCEAP